MYTAERQALQVHHYGRATHAFLLADGATCMQAQTCFHLLGLAPVSIRYYCGLLDVMWRSLTGPPAFQRKPHHELNLADRGSQNRILLLELGQDHLRACKVSSAYCVHSPSLTWLQADLRLHLSFVPDVQMSHHRYARCQSTAGLRPTRSVKGLNLPHDLQDGFRTCMRALLAKSCPRHGGSQWQVK